MERVLGGYVLSAPLTSHGDLPAAGGRAVLWSGRRRADDLPVVVKLFDAADRQRADREAEIGAMVDHPHVLAAIEVVADDEVVGIVLPHAAGGSLAALIAARRRLRWTEALTVLIPLADALAAAHERGLIHGDLSAANVLFDADGRPLLADFGAARVAGECGLPVAVTVTDMAPELARGAAPSAAADMFSLGSIALWALLGHGAWPAETVKDVVVAAAVGQWPDPGDLVAPKRLAAIVRHLLEPEPGDRMSAAGAAVALRGAGQPEAIELVRRGPDGQWQGPAPATVVRDDAIRPPAARAEQAAARRRAAWPAFVSAIVRRAGKPVAILGSASVLIAAAIWAGVAWAGAAHHGPTAAGDDTTAGGAAHAVSDAATHSAAADRAPVSTGSSTATIDSAAGSATIDAATGTTAGWMAVVERLDRDRSAAFAERDVDVLDSVYTADAPGLRSDRARIGRLVDRGLMVTGARHRIESVRVGTRSAGDTVILVVRQALPSYPVTDESRTVVARTDAVASGTVEMTVVRVAGQYRIARIVEV